MNQLIIFTPLLLIAACSPSTSTIKWDKYCLPKAYLTPASLSTAPSNDSNFDKNTGYGPSIFFEGKELHKHISSFKVTSPSHSTGHIYHHIQVNLSNNKIIKHVLNIENLRRSDMENIKFEDQSPYHWVAYDKAGSDYLYWGDCMLDGHGETDPSYRCTHQFNIGDTVGTYTIKDENILLHQKVDEFILNKLNTWQCK
jgi:hypothetical protein